MFPHTTQTLRLQVTGCNKAFWRTNNGLVEHPIKFLHNRVHYSQIHISY